MNNTFSRMFFIISITVIVGWIFYILESILVPFIIAWFVAFLCYPIIRIMSKYLPLWLSIILLFCIIGLAVTGLVVVLLPQIEHQIQAFIANESIYSKRVYHAVLVFDNHLNIAPTELLGIIGEHLKEFGAHVMATPNRIINTASTFFGLLLDLLIVPVVAFYLLLDWQNLQSSFMNFIPKYSKTGVLSILNKSSYILRRFIHGELIIMLVTGSVYVVGLEFSGVPLALPMAITAGLVCSIPFASLLLTAIPAFVFSLLEADIRMIVIVMVTIFIAEFLNNLILTPVLVGKYVKIHPAVALLLILSSGALYGVIGMILALPVSAIVSYHFLPDDEVSIQGR